MRSVSMTWRRQQTVLQPLQRHRFLPSGNCTVLSIYKSASSLTYIRLCSRAEISIYIYKTKTSKGHFDFFFFTSSSRLRIYNYNYNIRTRDGGDIPKCHRVVTAGHRTAYFIACGPRMYIIMTLRIKHRRRDGINTLITTQQVSRRRRRRPHGVFTIITITTTYTHTHTHTHNKQTTTNRQRRQRQRDVIYYNIQSPFSLCTCARARELV